MLHLLTLAALGASTSALAIPQITDGGGITPPYPLNTTVSYYNVGGWPDDDRMCLDLAGNGTIHASVCTKINYPGFGVWMVPHNNCTLTIFEGTDSCDGRATEMETYQVPAGKSLVCVSTDVDGGGKTSGVWACR